LVSLPAIRLRESLIPYSLLTFLVVWLLFLAAYASRKSAAYQDGDVLALTMAFSILLGCPARSLSAGGSTCAVQAYPLLGSQTRVSLSAPSRNAGL